MRKVVVRFLFALFLVNFVLVSSIPAQGMEAPKKTRLKVDGIT